MIRTDLRPKTAATTPSEEVAPATTAKATTVQGDGFAASATAASGEKPALGTSTAAPKTGTSGERPALTPATTVPATATGASATSTSASNTATFTPASATADQAKKFIDPFAILSQSSFWGGFHFFDWGGFGSRPAPKPGPISLTSYEGKKAVEKALAEVEQKRPNLNPDGSAAYRAVSVERDDKGIIHVKLQRIFAGKDIEGDTIEVKFDKNWGEQGIKGKMHNLSMALWRLSNVITLQLARLHALKDFGGSPEAKAALRRVVFETVDGGNRLAYRVRCTDPADGRRAVLFLDAHSGEVLRRQALDHSSRPPERRSMETSELWGTSSPASKKL